MLASVQPAHDHKLERSLLSKRNITSDLICVLVGTTCCFLCLHYARWHMKCADLLAHVELGPALCIVSQKILRSYTACPEEAYPWRITCKSCVNSHSVLSHACPLVKYASTPWLGDS